MAEEFNLDADLVEKHYESLVSSTEEYTESVTVVEDSETNISVKDDSMGAYKESCSMEELVKSCINADAENLSKLGQSFLTLDDNLTEDINALITYEDE